MAAEAAVAPDEVKERSPDSVWFWDHYDWAAGEIVEFLAEDGVTLTDRDVADVGCGDGIMALGVVHKARPRRLTGYDVRLTNSEILEERARSEGVATPLPPALEFVESGATRLPAPDDSYDVVTTWSAFEHIGEPEGVLREIARVLRPEGVLFLQLWPFYHSERGSHLWDWFPDGFHHLERDEHEIVKEMTGRDVHPSGFTEYMASEFRQLNQVTLDELNEAIHSAGLDVIKVELMTNRVRVPRSLGRRYPLSQLAIGGVKLLATHARDPDSE